MAVRIANKFPLDSKARVAIGVSIPFSGDAVFNSTYTTKDQIKSNLINYFMTGRGERYMNPTFGGGLRDFLFEQLVTQNFEFIKERVQSDLRNMFPNIVVGELDVYGNEEQNILKVELTYQVVNFGITDNLSLIIQ